MTEREKYKQITKEAIWTGVALLLIIVGWIFAGFGLSKLNVFIFGIPLWTITSSIGVWLVSLLIVKVLITYVFKDINFEKEEDK